MSVTPKCRRTRHFHVGETRHLYVEPTIVESGHPAPPGCEPQRFPDAPRRTRRAPFVTHRALPRCLRIVRTGVRPRLITHDTDGGQSYGDRSAVSPAQRLLARLVPAILSSKFIHLGVGMLLAEPAFDGPPKIVVY